MKRILVLYGTTEGHTAKIAGAIAAGLNQEGCFASVADAARGLRLAAEEYDAVIVAASLHAGGYQRSVRRWLRANAAALAHRPTAFVSVCLAVLEHRPAVDQHLGEIVRRFLAPLGWQPGQVKQVAGALPYTRYGWLKKIVMRRMAAKAGGDTDTTRDFEYTDWTDLRAFAQAFAREHELAPIRESAEPAVDAGLHLTL